MSLSSTNTALCGDLIVYTEIIPLFLVAAIWDVEWEGPLNSYSYSVIKLQLYSLLHCLSPNLKG